MRRRHAHRSGRRLARAQAFFRRFNAVVGAIAHQMGQRIADKLDQLPIELGVGALGDEVDLFIQIIGQIADHARQIGEDALDRLHARPHHRVLKVRRHGGQALQWRFEQFVTLMPRQLDQLVARQHQLRDELHDAFEHIEIYAYRFGAFALRRLGYGGFVRLGGLRFFGRRRGVRFNNIALTENHMAFEQRDKIEIVALHLLPGFLKLREHQFYAIHRHEDGRNHVRRGLGAFTQLADQNSPPHGSVSEGDRGRENRRFP